MPPFWNLISLALPMVTAVVGSIVLRLYRGCNFAEALGGFLILLIAIGAASVAGEAAAIAAVMRGERLAVLSVFGILLNGAAILAAVALVVRMQ